MLDRMSARGGAARWVAERARGWLEHWRRDIGRAGFYPFDAIAAAFVLRPDLLRCAHVAVRVGSDSRFAWRWRERPALLVGTGAQPANDAAQARSPVLYHDPEVSAPAGETQADGKAVC